MLLGNLGLQPASEEEYPLGAEEENINEDFSDSHSTSHSTYEELNIAKTDAASRKLHTQPSTQDPCENSLTGKTISYVSTRKSSPDLYFQNPNQNQTHPSLC